MAAGIENSVRTWGSAFIWLKGRVTGFVRFLLHTPERELGPRKGEAGTLKRQVT